MKTTIDKAELKKQIIYNVKTLYRKTIDEATPQQVFQAVSYALKDDIIDQWIATHKEIERTDAKTLYYLSMEFLMGRALGNNILNLCAQNEVKEVLEELGFDLNTIEDQEPDPALGNGGLGRLAAHLAIRHMDVESVTSMVCLHRRSRTVIREKFRMTG